MNSRNYAAILLVFEWSYVGSHWMINALIAPEVERSIAVEYKILFLCI